MTTKLIENRNGDMIEVSILRSDIITTYEGQTLHQWVEWANPEECKQKNASEPDPRWYLIDTSGYIKESSDIRLCYSGELPLEVLTEIEWQVEKIFDWQPGVSYTINI